MGKDSWLCLPSVDRRKSRCGRQVNKSQGWQKRFLYKAKPLPGSSDTVLPLGDRCDPPGAPNDITKGLVCAPVSAHYYTYLPRLELGLLSSKWCLRLLLLQDGPSAPAETPGARGCSKLEAPPPRPPKWPPPIE